MAWKYKMPPACGSRDKNDFTSIVASIKRFKTLFRIRFFGESER